MSHTIRPFTFTDSDYQAVVDLRNQLYPDIPSTIEIWKHNDLTRRQDPSYQFFVIEDDAGDIQAFAQSAKTHPTSCTVSIGLIGRPHTWSNGMAQALLNQVKSVAAELQATALVQKVQESDSAKLAFLHDQGFETIIRYPLSVLDVARFDPTPFEDKILHTQALGIDVAPMPRDWQLKTKQQKFVHDFDWKLRLDVPSLKPRQKKSLKQFLAENIFHPNALLDSFFIACDDRTSVGMTCFVKRGLSGQVVTTALTGVLRSYRCQGVATALKVASIQFAQSAGYRTILTNNEENNPMHKLNLQLGFKERPAWLDLQLKLPNI